ncbi:DUF3500 domain-containing protein [Kribbella italica]|uniref:DUF3500 domain-containing protein n=1 Tax=Kribbella italica TaxID=1540520 RepID=A0A7W9MSI2_9ACTN|nr:DUF3500 domain-containing protein [Kribbella italica]MBB5834599.1 hypothetical protein [Kribbella italica]
MVVEQTRKTALELLDALTSEQRAKATAPFDTPDHREWTYLPGDRPGLQLTELTAEQEQHVHRLLELACSERGVGDALATMAAEIILRELPDVGATGGWQGTVVGERYFLRILGDPSGTDPWAWRLNGHHLALHVTLVGDRISFVPNFIGSNPAEVRQGPYAGRRFLAAEHDLGFQLLHALDSSQREVAVVSTAAPDDILTRHDPVADASLLHRGIAYGDLQDSQQDLFTRLLDQYVGRAAQPIAEQAWANLRDQGLDHLTFAWAGALQPGAGHYYSIAGPTFLAEYDNTQSDANHIHSVWRDLDNDWGQDLLAAHYAAHR